MSALRSSFYDIAGTVWNEGSRDPLRVSRTLPDEQFPNGYYSVLLPLSDCGSTFILAFDRARLTELRDVITAALEAAKQEEALADLGPEVAAGTLTEADAKRLVVGDAGCD